MNKQDKQNLVAILNDYVPANWQNDLIRQELIVKLGGDYEPSNDRIVVAKVMDEVSLIKLIKKNIAAWAMEVVNEEDNSIQDVSQSYDEEFASFVTALRDDEYLPPLTTSSNK